VREAAADPISQVRRPAQPVAQPTRGVGKAGANGVLVSQTVKDLVAGSGLTFEGAGKHELKGVPDSWRLYRVVG
jgi:class 3 adenylate cyclase